MSSVIPFRSGPRGAQLWRSLSDALRKLNPATLGRNPVLFMVEIGSVFTTVLAILDSSISAWPITAWLWLTVIFADLAEALGTTQVAILRGSSQDARKLAGSSPDRRTATCGGAAWPRPRRPDLRCHHQSRARRVGRDAWLAHRCGRRCLRDADVLVQVPALAGSRALRQLDVPIGLDPLLSHRFPVVDMVVAS